MLVTLHLETVLIFSSASHLTVHALMSGVAGDMNLEFVQSEHAFDRVSLPVLLLSYQLKIFHEALSKKQAVL